jgi:DNA repair exonuclease SbcCD ATPase subunit
MDAEDQMTEQTTLLSRIGRWFKRDNENGDQPIDRPASPTTALDTRTTFLRPWAKRDAAIQHLQEGFTTLTDLMGAIRDNLEKQNQRQDELMNALTQLPQMLESLPESNRMQGETLKAIHQQIESQSSQQQRLGDILNKIGTTTGEQKQMVDALRTRVEDLHKADTSIAEYLNNVGSSLKDVSQNSASTTQVLSSMRDNIDARDGQLERVLHKQGSRFTIMLATAIFLSIAALVAVCVMGYLMLNPPVK